MKATAQRWVAGVAVGGLLGAVGLGFVVVSEQRTIRELERSQEQASVQFEELSGDLASLSAASKPTNYADDIAAIQDSLDKLTDKLDRIDIRTTGDLTELARVIDDDRAHFERCIDDLILLSNGDRPSGGLVC